MKQWIAPLLVMAVAITGMTLLILDVKRDRAIARNAQAQCNGIVFTDVEKNYFCIVNPTIVPIKVKP